MAAPTPPSPKLKLLAPENWREYALLDSGEGKTLERFGPYLLISPEPQAVWKITAPGGVAKGARGFAGRKQRVRRFVASS